MAVASSLRRPPRRECALRKFGEGILGELPDGGIKAIALTRQLPAVEIVTDRPPPFTVEEPRDHAVDLAILEALDDLGRVHRFAFSANGVHASAGLCRNWPRTAQERVTGNQLGEAGHR